MKFTLIKDLKQDSVMSPILSGLLFFIILYLVSDIFVKDLGFGISVHTINLTLFGSEEEFLDPITQASFLEFWHVEIFFIMMIVFTLSTIFIRVSNASKSAIVLVNLMMISSIISLISLPFAYFFSSEFINIYVATFFIWHILAILSSLYSLKRLHYA
jgi:hypothetical protein